ncbi:unnamed protein product, partial [Ilex paraguariensis]
DVKSIRVFCKVREVVSVRSGRLVLHQKIPAVSEICAGTRWIPEMSAEKGFSLIRQLTVENSEGVVCYKESVLHWFAFELGAVSLKAWSWTAGSSPIFRRQGAGGMLGAGL